MVEHTDGIDRMKVISQIEQDWTAKPFVKIESFEGNCPDGWETLFEKVWHGLEEGCLYDYWKATEWTYVS